MEGLIAFLALLAALVAVGVIYVPRIIRARDTRRDEIHYLTIDKQEATKVSSDLRKNLSQIREQYRRLDNDYIELLEKVPDHVPLGGRLLDRELELLSGQNHQGSSGETGIPTKVRTGSDSDTDRIKP